MTPMVCIENGELLSILRSIIQNYSPILQLMPFETHKNQTTHDFMIAFDELLVKNDQF